MAYVKRIGIEDVSILQTFIETAGKSTRSFRYFSQRPLTVIANHLLTIGLFVGEKMVGYGHLDPEDGKIWLGIAVSENWKGMGLGKQIMVSLVEFAKRNLKKPIQLTVDKSNVGAIALYHQFGFKKVREINNSVILMKLEIE